MIAQLSPFILCGFEQTPQTNDLKLRGSSAQNKEGDNVNNKTTKHSILIPTVTALTTALLLGVGLSACDNREDMTEGQMRMGEATTENQIRMDDPMHNAKEHNTQGVMSDTWITTKVKTDLLADSVAKGLEIEVDTVHGVVSLKGKVKDAGTVQHVQQIADNVEGVTKVNTNNLLLESKSGY